MNSRRMHEDDFHIVELVLDIVPRRATLRGGEGLKNNNLDRLIDVLNSLPVKGCISPNAFQRPTEHGGGRHPPFKASTRANACAFRCEGQNNNKY